MAAMDFPANPTDGQVYGNYVYSTSTGAWLARSVSQQVAVTSPTAPSNPVNGTLWYNTNDGSTYIYYYDGDSSQWVQAKSDATLSSTLGSRVDALDYGANINYVINGDLSINQRGFTSTSTGATFGFDRFYLIRDAGGTSTYSAQTFSPGQAPVAGIEAKNYARLVTSGQTATSTYTALVHNIEDIREFAGQTVTVSFYARAATGSPKIALEVAQSFGTGGSPSSATFTPGGTVTISNSWTRYSMTVAVPSIAGKTLGTTENTSYTQFSWWVSGGSDYNARLGSIGIQSNTFDMWGFQVQKGVTATAFHRSMPTLQGELAACQRYYWRWLNEDTNQYFGIVDAWNGQGLTVIKHPVTMRTRPTSIEVSAASDFRLNWSGSSLAVTAVALNGSSTQAATIQVSAAVNNNAPYALYATTAAAYLGFSAEL